MIPITPMQSVTLLYHQNNFSTNKIVIGSFPTQIYGKIGVYNLSSLTFKGEVTINAPGIGVVILGPTSASGNRYSHISTDGGVTYTTGSYSIGTGAIPSLAYSGSMLSTGSYYSSNGIAWTQSGTVSISHISSACWSPTLSMFVYSAGFQGAGTIGAMGYSYDGNYVQAGSDIGSAFNNLEFSHVIWVSDWSKFISVSNNPINIYAGSQIVYSVTGVTWSLCSVPTGEFNAVSYSPTLGVAVAVGNHGNFISSDGITWVGAGGPGVGFISIFWLPTDGLFFSIESGSNRTGWISNDGHNWARVLSSDLPAPWAGAAQGMAIL